MVWLTFLTLGFNVLAFGFALLGRPALHKFFFAMTILSVIAIFATGAGAYWL